MKQTPLLASLPLFAVEISDKLPTCFVLVYCNSFSEQSGASLVCVGKS